MDFDNYFRNIGFANVLLGKTIYFCSVVAACCSLLQQMYSETLENPIPETGKFKNLI